MKNISNSSLVALGLAFILLGFLIWPCDHSPKVIVNIPANAQQLQTLPTDTKIVPEDKAVLWWTVFKYTLDKPYYPSDAAKVADRAVDKIYQNK